MDELAEGIRARYRVVRNHSEALCDHLEVEDLCLQGMADTSPLKWHLAHTTWFFETFILKPFWPGYSAYRDEFEYLFNSYYNAVGRQYPRPDRHMLSRPTVAEVLAYRQAVNESVESLLLATPQEGRDDILYRLILGCHHEQQHQELMLTDLKYCLAMNPLQPAYNPSEIPSSTSSPLTFSQFDGGDCQIGNAFAGQPVVRPEAFSFDNEGPRHRRWLAPFALADRPVTNGEYLEFVEAGGYEQPQWWHSDGWATVRQEGWQMPLYWQRDGGQYGLFTLHGLVELDSAAPVCHVSLYEALAFAAWKGMRLCREDEWEYVASQQPVEGHLGNTGCQQPLGPATGRGIRQLYGDVWEWTLSAYGAYPGYQAQAGALGEYNGKFMLNQMVLRGGSVATPQGHIRATYRNFFYPKDRWQFSGIRLAHDL